VTFLQHNPKILIVLLILIIIRKDYDIFSRLANYLQA